jgi:predicted ribonuclease YlaK
VVLVSKDINMRVKARALGLATDDYQNDKTLEDGDLLYAGSLALPTDFWATHGRRSRAGNRACTPSTASAARWFPAC